MEHRRESRPFDFVGEQWFETAAALPRNVGQTRDSRRIPWVERIVATPTPRSPAPDLTGEWQAVEMNDVHINTLDSIDSGDARTTHWPTSRP